MLIAFYYNSWIKWVFCKRRSIRDSVACSWVFTGKACCFVMISSITILKRLSLIHIWGLQRETDEGRERDVWNTKCMILLFPFWTSGNVLQLETFFFFQQINPLTSNEIMMMTLIRVIINHVCINRCLSFKVGWPNCNVHIQVHFFPHFLTDSFYSPYPQSAITKWTQCQPQSQSQESTYNGQLQPRKPQ